MHLSSAVSGRAATALTACCGLALYGGIVLDAGTARAATPAHRSPSPSVSASVSAPATSTAPAPPRVAPNAVTPSRQDHTAPYAEIAPATGSIPAGGSALTLDITFHNTLGADITDSFIVTVGVALPLAPPAPALTPGQVRVEWYDATPPATWRPVELTPGETALSGFLTVDGSLPSTGSIPAGQTARTRVRVSLDASVPTGGTLQFVTKGMLYIPGFDPIPLMDGAASYGVVAPPTTSPTPTPSPHPTPTPTGAPTGTGTPTPTGTGRPSPTPSASPTPSPARTTGGPGDSTGDPEPVALGGSGGPAPTDRGRLASTGTPALLAYGVGGAAAAGAGAGLLVLRRRRLTPGSGRRH